jgi:hypothetical protein
MKENYDFSKGTKNPYANKLKKGYAVTVHYDFINRDEETEQKTMEDGKSKKAQKQA